MDDVAVALQKVGLAQVAKLLAHAVVDINAHKAIVFIGLAGCASRVIEMEGRPQIVTQDCRLDRVSLRVRDGIVFAAEVG